MSLTLGREALTNKIADDLATRNANAGLIEGAVNAFGQPSMTGSATLNGTTDNTVQLTSIVTTLGLEVGDVIRIQYSGYDKLHTVESIANNDSIVVNYEHAGNRGNGSLKLPNFTGQATVTRIAKWFNAPIGLGQAWQDVTGRRSLITIYTNTTGRAIYVKVISEKKTTGVAQLQFKVDDTRLIDFLNVAGTSLAGGTVVTVSGAIPFGVTYICAGVGTGLGRWWELR